MKPISDFFERFKNIRAPHGALKKTIANALHDSAGIAVSPNSISIQNGTAFIRASSIAKNTIHINRGKILKQIFDELPSAQESLRDIR